MLSFGFRKFSLLDSVINLKGSVDQPLSESKAKNKKVKRTLQSVKSMDTLISKDAVSSLKNISQESLFKDNEESKPVVRKTRCNRNNSVKENPLNSYLYLIQQNKQQSQAYKKDIQKFIGLAGDYVHQLQGEYRIKDNQPTLPSLQGQVSLLNEAKFKKLVTIENSELSSHRKPSLINSESISLLYAQKNEQIFQELQKTIRDFHSKLEQLRKLWKNNQRVEKYIKSKISLKLELKQLLFPSEDISNLQLTMFQMIKLFKYKDQKYGYDRYHFVAGEQLKDIVDCVSKILEQQKIIELQEIKRQILDQRMMIQQLEDTDLVQRSRIKRSFDYLSFESPAMQNTNKDELLEKIERVHGTLMHVGLANRTMNNAINSTIQALK